MALKHRWKLDETSPGHGRLNYQNSEDVSEAGKLGNAQEHAYFGARTDTFTPVRSSASGSVACWFRRRATSAYSNMWGNYPSSNKGIYLGMETNGNQLSYGFGSTERFSTGYVIPNLTWIHGVLTWDNSNINIYVTGSLLGSYARSGTPNLEVTMGICQSKAAHSFSLISAGYPRGFPGRVDDWRYYDETLGLAEVQELYNSGSGTTASLGTYQEVTHLSLDDNTGSKVFKNFDSDHYIADSVGGYDGVDFGTRAYSDFIPARELQALGSSIEIGDKDDLKFTNEDFSFTFWMAAPNRFIGSEIFSKWNIGDGAESYRCYASTITENLEFEDSDGNKVGISVPVDDTMHLYTITRSGTTVKIYKDKGSPITNTGFLANFVDTTAKFNIGCRDREHGEADGYNNSFHVRMADFRHYDHELTVGDIENIYDSAAFGSPVIQNQDPAPSASNVEFDTQVYYEIRTSGSIDPTNHHVWLDYGDEEFVLVYSSGSWQNDHTGEVVINSSSSYDVTINPVTDFGFTQNIRVQALATTTDYDQVDEIWTFTTETDPTAPSITINPADGTIMNYQRHIFITFLDDITSIDLAATTVEIDKGEGSDYEMAYSGSSFQSGFEGSMVSSQGGKLYNMEVYPTNNFSKGISGKVRAITQDSATNEATATSNFRTLTKSSKRGSLVSTIKINRAEFSKKHFLNIFSRNKK